jgi:8-oxo-dGTP pyrophosphatase MutT (NUDIX family)
MDTPSRTLNAWPSVIAARAYQAVKRTPFFVAHTEAAPVPVGSVARADLPALRRWPQWLQVYDDAVTLLATPAARDEVMTRINEALHADGLIRAWRDETFALYTVHGRPIGASMERAAMRFWGALTLGAHCNGYVADSHGRPAALWVARRSFTKATDPGKLDNLVGGGVPVDQTPRETVVREAWEEAGLTPRQMHGLVRGRVLRLLRDIPEGLQREWIHVYDLNLPVGLTPRNQDGEVAEVQLQPLADALALAAGDEMTVDAALVTLDFALRHHLLDDDDDIALLEEAAAVLYQGQAA